MTEAAEIYMHRCLELARLGAGAVAPNPMVGAVLVYGNRIIGEGYHHFYGGPHAEVNCLASVSDDDRLLIALATLYVSLEPCSHFGKTPPCTNLVLANGIKKVVIGSRDPHLAVNGQGISLLRKEGVEVTTGVLEAECQNLNKRFFTYHTKERPYVVLKWAQSANGFISGDQEDRLYISNAYTNRLVHQWRQEESAICIGTNTAIRDNPSLDNRHWSGKSPVRLLLDRNLRVPQTLALFDNSQATIIFNYWKEGEENGVRYCQIDKNEDFLQAVVKACYKMQLQSILVEGGAKLLQSFIVAGLWDEARVITNQSLQVAAGIAAPVLFDQTPVNTQKIATDMITYYTHSLLN